LQEPEKNASPARGSFLEGIAAGPRNRGDVRTTDAGLVAAPCFPTTMALLARAGKLAAIPSVTA
jgi:hypothetical protein